MRTILIALALAVVGCGSRAAVQPVRADGPAPADQELAFEIVWDDVYGMAKEQRPIVTWWTPCPDELTGAASDPICASENSTPGDMNVAWNGSTISGTHFSAWLDAQRIFIRYPTFFPASLPYESERLTRAAQDSLRMAGL